jgi:hypothetical protein
MSMYISPAAQSSAAWNSFYAYIRYHAVPGDNPVGDLISDARSDKSFPTDIDGPEDLQSYTALPAKFTKQLWRNYVKWLDANNANLPVLKSRPISKHERQRLRREELPYGCWTTGSGREVLFNRRCQPIWERAPDGQVQSADRDEWVPDIVATTYFYKSATDESEEYQLHQAIAAAQSWGVPTPDIYFSRIDIHNV